MEQEEVQACWGTPLFSLLTSQTREACERVPQHTQAHSHTPLKDTSTCTHMYHPHHLNKHTRCHQRHRFHHAHTDRPFSNTNSLSPATHNKTHPDISPSAHMHLHNIQPEIITPPSDKHKQILRVRPDPTENPRNTQ